MLTSFQMLWGQSVGHPAEMAQTTVCAMLVQVPEGSCFPKSWHNHRSICWSSSQSWTHSHHIQMIFHLPWQQGQYHYKYLIYTTYYIYLHNLYITVPKNLCYTANLYPYPQTPNDGSLKPLWKQCSRQDIDNKLCKMAHLSWIEWYQ